MKHDEHSLRDLLQRFAAQKPFKDKLFDKKIEEKWLGLYQKIATYTTRVQFREGTLTIWLSSAPLRQELKYHKEKIINQLNDALQESVIKQIDFK